MSDTNTDINTKEITPGTESDEQEKRAKYYEACYLMGEAQTVSQLDAVEAMFSELGDHSDSADRLEQCRKKREELLAQKAQEDAVKAEEDKKLRVGYDDLREEARRIGKTLRNRDAAKRYREIAQTLADRYSSIEGAADYAREYIKKSELLDAAHGRRKKFETISSIIIGAVAVIVAVIYILVFAKAGRSFRPLIPLTLCDCVMLAGFVIGYKCEGGAGAAASVLSAAGFAAMAIATLILCIAKRLSLGFSGYIAIIFLPVIIGFVIGMTGGAVWGIFAKRAENAQVIQDKGRKSK